MWWYIIKDNWDVYNTMFKTKEEAEAEVERIKDNYPNSTFSITQ
jgi:hypothetical protein